MPCAAEMSGDGERGERRGGKLVEVDAQEVRGERRKAERDAKLLFW